MLSFLRQADCVFDVMNMAVTWGSSVRYVTRHSSPALHWQRAHQRCCARGSSKSKSKQKRKCTLLRRCRQSHHLKPAEGQICTFSAVSGQLASSLSPGPRSKMSMQRWTTTTNKKTVIFWNTSLKSLSKSDCLEKDAHTKKEVTQGLSLKLAVRICWRLEKSFSLFVWNEPAFEDWK